MEYIYQNLNLSNFSYNNYYMNPISEYKLISEYCKYSLDNIINITFILFALLLLTEIIILLSYKFKILDRLSKIFKDGLYISFGIYIFYNTFHFMVIKKYISENTSDIIYMVFMGLIVLLIFLLGRKYKKFLNDKVFPD